MPLPKKVESVQRQLMREEVYQVIQRWIVEGTLHPGEKVRDLELAEALGVSRTPVREALRRLGDEGLVEMEANRWTRVSPLDPEYGKRIHPIVASLEPLAIEQSEGRLAENEIEEMRRANARMRRAIEAGKPADAARADSELHAVYLQATGNRDLIKILSDLKVKLRRLDVANYAGGSVADGRSVEEHEALIEALSRGEFERAAEIVRENWREPGWLTSQLEPEASGSQRS